MKNKFLWHDAKVEKPTTIDPVMCLTSDGYIVIAQWTGKWWYERSSDESYGNVVKWTDFKLPSGWKISDEYYLYW